MCRLVTLTMKKKKKKGHCHYSLFARGRERVKEGDHNDNDVRESDASGVGGGGSWSGWYLQQGTLYLSEAFQILSEWVGLVNIPAKCTLGRCLNLEEFIV